MGEHIQIQKQDGQAGPIPCITDCGGVRGLVVYPQLTFKEYTQVRECQQLYPTQGEKTKKNLKIRELHNGISVPV